MDKGALLMFNQLYRFTASTTAAGLLLATFALTPVAAQDQPSADMSATIAQNPCAIVQASGAAEQQMGDQSGDQAAVTADQATETTANAPAELAAAVQAPCPGTNLETAGPPFAEQIQIEPGVQHWYRFRYSPNTDDDSDEDNNAVVSLQMEQPGCVSFEVTTTGRLRNPFDDEGDPIGPVGRGTAFNTGDETNESNLLWVGSADFSESYLVIVRNRTDSACSYTLSITGAPVVY